MKEGERNLKTPRHSRSNIKSMLILFFERHRIVLHEFFRVAPEASEMNGQYYLDILKQLHARIARVRPELFAANSSLLQHDNAPPHMSHVVVDWLAKNGMTQMLHSPHSPDMAPCDFWAFLKVKKVLKNVHWGSAEEIERVTTQAL